MGACALLTAPVRLAPRSARRAAEPDAAVIQADMHCMQSAEAGRRSSVARRGAKGISCGMEAERSPFSNGSKS